MKAVVLRRIGGPEYLGVEEVETPEPRPGQVRVALRASALNRRDLWITLGLYPRIQLPCILGSDGAGVVDWVGADVDPVWLGREVIIYPAYGWGSDPRYPVKSFRVLGMPEQGTFAEFICVPVEQVFDRPSGLDWQQAAAVPLAGLTAWRAVVTQAAVQPGERVLVTGIGGGVATFAMRWAIALGASVWVTSGDQAKIQQALALGATAGVDYHDPEWVQRLSALSEGFDAIVDGTGGPFVNGYLSLLKYGGRLVCYGATAGNPPEGLEMARLFYRQIQIRGTTMGSLSEFAAMLSFLSDQGIVPLIARVFPLAEAVDAHRYLQSSARMGKVVLRQG